MDIAEKIQIYGDSIMRGILLDKEKCKYYSMPEDDLSEIRDAYSLQIVNKSRFGCTVEKGYKLLQNAIDKGLDCDMIFLEYGGNDCNFNWNEVSENPEKEHKPFTPIDLFENLYRKIIVNLKGLGITPIIMSLPPIDAEKYFNWISQGLCKENILSWLGDVQMIYRFQELYSSKVTQLAYETNSPYIDIRSAFLDKHNYKKLLCDDGIHPNEAGHKLSLIHIFYR